MAAVFAAVYRSKNLRTEVTVLRFQAVSKSWFFIVNPTVGIIGRKTAPAGKDKSGRSGGEPNDAASFAAQLEDLAIFRNHSSIGVNVLLVELSACPSTDDPAKRYCRRPRANCQHQWLFLAVK